MEQESLLESTSENTIAEALRRLRELYNKEGVAFHERILKKIAELQKRYPDYDEYQSYHLAIGSSEKREKLDFPGEDSIFEWLKKMNNE